MPALIIPDIHQNLDFARRALDLASPADTVVFLGDYFDSRDPRWATEAVFVDTLNALREWAERPRTVCLLGNHDMPVLTSCPPHYPRYPVPRFDYGQAQRHLEEIAHVPWHRFQLFHVEQGWLLSHAGFHRRYWEYSADRRSDDSADSVDAGIGRLRRLCRHALEGVNERNQTFFQKGLTRGGSVARPGPTWQCWSEFDDSLPLPQIVGHTAGPLPRRKGRSWNIDCAQRCVAWIEDGEVTIQTME